MVLRLETANPEISGFYVTPAGGTTERPLDQWLADQYINVKAFGATGNGSTDDTAFINAALVYANTLGGGVVFFPPGTYSVADTLFMYSRTTLLGAGRGLSILKPSAAMPLSKYLIENADIDLLTSARTQTDLTVQSLGFDGSLRVYPRWLQHTEPHAAAGTPVTNPDVDYNGTPFPNGIALSQAAGGAGNLTLNGAMTVSGVADMPIGRLVTADSSGNDSARTLTCTGYGYDNLGLVSTVAAGNATEVTFPVGFKRVTDVHIDGATSGTIRIGVKFDINGVVAIGRRNSLYSHATTNGGMIRFRKVVRPKVIDCHFYDHHNMVTVEGGCLDAIWQGNLFERCGKNDGPFHCIYSSHFGTSGGASYAPSENTHILYNRASNIERFFSWFTPRKGGRMIGNVIINCAEGGFVCPGDGASDGGEIIVENNVWKHIRISDIVGAMLDSSGSRSLYVRNNYFEDSDHLAISIVGGEDKIVEGNVFKNCWQLDAAATYPYGPFSERYGYNQGTASLAGTPLPLAERMMCQMGSLKDPDGDKPNIRVGIRNNTFIQTAGPIPGNFCWLTRTGAAAANLSDRLFIENNDCAFLPSPLLTPARFLNLFASNVLTTDMDLTIKGNKGHTSDGAYSFEHTFAAATTGTVTFSDGLNGNPGVGFRPKFIQVMVVSGSPANGRQAYGTALWERGVAAGSSDGAISWTNDTGGSRNVMGTTNFLLLYDNAGAPQFAAPLLEWLENGFSVNVTLATIGAKARFVCFP